MPLQDAPPKLDHPAPKWFVDKWEEMRQWMIAHRPVPGPGLLMTDAPGGGKVIHGGSGTGGVTISQHPFQLIDASAEGETKLRVRFGTVNDAIPTGMTEGDTPVYETTDLGTNSGSIWLHITADMTTGLVSSVAIDWGASLPSNTSGNYYRRIGTFNTVDDVFFYGNNIVSSQWFQLCGLSTPLWGAA
jgi:hypothetical protein